jgi:PQQ-like domain
MRRAFGFVVVSFVLAMLSVPAVAAPGHRAWIARFNGGPGISIDEATAVATSSNGGRVYVGGCSEGKGGLAVVAYRYSGAVAWRSPVFVPPAGSIVSDVGDLVVSTDDRHVVLTADLLGHKDRMAAVAFDAATGAIEWTWVRAPGPSRPRGIAAGPGRVFVIGDAGGKDSDWFVAALRPATGAVVWSRQYDAPDGAAHPSGVAFSGGHVFVTGSAATAATDIARTVSYAASDGSRDWTDRYAGARFAMLAGVSRDGSRLVILAGRKIVLYRTGSGVRRVVRFRHPWSGLPVDVAINRKGTRAFVAGYETSGGANVTAAAFDLDEATRLWRFVGPASDGGVAVDVSPSGSEVYVAGYTQLTAAAWKTQAFVARTGALVWSDVYRGPLQDQSFPRAMTVAPEGGRVYVVGYVAATRSDDFATVAYATR